MKKEFILTTLCFVILLFGATAHAQKSGVDSLIPILGNYANKSVPLGGSSTLTPDTGASNIGTATVTASGNFKGAISVSPSSGAVRVLNAYPAGNYTVTVRASDFAGFSVTRSFTLTVTNVSSCNTLDFAGIRSTVGINPLGLVTADFNGDGRQDIVAAVGNFNGANGRANVIVLLRNAANNGFDAPAGFNGSYILQNSQTQKIIVGEVNGDGRQDLITSNGTNGGLQANFSVMPRVCTVDLNLLGALPNGTAGQIYSKTIYASGGIAPYNFTVSGLPNGLNFTTTADSVTIFGTPSTGGQFNISIGISDSNPLTETNIAPQTANALTQVLPLQIAFAPTAANVSVSGRISTADGRNLRGAIVTLTDANGTTRTTRSTAFGIFRFDEIEVGQTITISVISKRFQFTPQVISVSEDVIDLNFTALE